jgi:hypothetical protein
MPGSGRKRAGPGPRNPWNAQLDAEERDLPTQAGEVDRGLEDGMGGGDKGIDADTGSGGYGGDAAAKGVDAADGQPDRPLTDEIHGDPRTHQDESYPEEEMRVDLDQAPPARTLENEDETDAE